MVDKELIEIWRNMLKPSISSRLLKTNYEGKGEQDKEEFERDFDEILDLALIGLEHKAQLSQERTKKRTETRACDLISRQAAIDALVNCTNCEDETTLRAHVAKHSLEIGWTGGILDAIDAIEDLPPAEPEQRWIPVSERLPELDEDGYSQKVLACFGNYSGCDILEYRATEGIGKWYIGDMDDSPEDIGVMVLAWMPLPEPYKEGGAGRRTDDKTNKGSSC